MEQSTHLEGASDATKQPVTPTQRVLADAAPQPRARLEVKLAPRVDKTFVIPIRAPCRHTGSVVTARTHRVYRGARE